MSSQEIINIESNPAPKFVYENAGQTFSLIAPTKFEFKPPEEKLEKPNLTKIDDQLKELENLNDKKKKNEEKEGSLRKIMNNLKTIKKDNDLREYFNRWRNAVNDLKNDDMENLLNKLNDILSRAKKESDDQNKKDVMDQLRKNQIKDFAVRELFRMLDTLYNDRINEAKNEFLDRLILNEDSQNALEFLDKLLERKLKEKFMNNLIKNENEKNGMKILDKALNYNIKKEFMDKFKKIADFKKGIDTLHKVLRDNMKRNVIEDFIKKGRLALYCDKLDKLINDKLKEKFMDRLRKNQIIKNICDKLDKIIGNKLKQEGLDALKNDTDLKKGMDIIDRIINQYNDKFKKDALDELKKRNDIAKAVEKLEKVINNKLKKDAFEELKMKSDIEKAGDMIKKIIDDKLKRDAFDVLKRINDFGKVIELLEKFINDKLKDDTLKKLKTMQFVDILEKMRKKKDDDDKNEKLNKLMNYLDKIVNNERAREREEEEARANKNLLNKYFNKWRDIADREKIKDELINHGKKKNAFNDWKNLIQEEDDKKDILRNLKKNKVLGNTINKINNDNLLKKYFDLWKENAAKANKSTKKRISRRTGPFKGKKKKNEKRMNKNLLRKAFDIWRENSSFAPKRNVLDKMKQNRLLLNNLNKENENQDDLLQKYKNKMLQVLHNIYKRQNNLILKKYFDKWNKTKNPEKEENEEKNDEPKYKKKPRIEDKREIVEEPDVNAFEPKYYVSKQNLYNKNPINANAPYIKRYAKRAYEKPADLYFEETPIKNLNEDEDMCNNKSLSKNNNNNNNCSNINIINKDDYSDTSSNNGSVIDNGEVLIQNRKIITQPRNYTSQSFFINKNSSNDNAQNNYQMNSQNGNQLPMTMKGDFVSLIENNPAILTKKNPRMQVINATCDLNEIINNETTEDELNSEDINNDLNRMNNIMTIDKNKVLSKVINKCDKDLYASQKPFKSNKSKWYSVSIPLNDNEAKWEILNNIKGERDKNNLNKFELIQDEIEPIKEERDEGRSFANRAPRSDRKSPNKHAIRDTSYKLAEMNYSQFYRSPMKSIITNDMDKSLISYKIKIPGKKQKEIKNSLNNSRISRRFNNLDRSRGKIEFDPRARSIDYDNRNAIFNNSDSD